MGRRMNNKHYIAVPVVGFLCALHDCIFYPLARLDDLLSDVAASIAQWAEKE